VLLKIFNLVFRALVGYYVLSLVGLPRVVDFSNGHWVDESVELAWSDLNVVEREDPEYSNDLKKFSKFCKFFSQLKKNAKAPLIPKNPQKS
jgi:hypothetical protein